MKVQTINRVLCLCGIIALWLVLMGCQNVPETGTPEGTRVEVAAVEDTAVAPTSVTFITPTLTITPTLAATLPPPPTLTPPPTSTSSPTPAATDTPAATNTPLPTATFTPAPTRLPPTATPTPLPTATPDTLGLSATFLIEGGTSFATNQDIWFNFDLKNPNQTEMEYGALGLLPRKDGVERLDLAQFSWTNATMFPNGMVWRDHINIPEPGDYTVRIAICFEAPLDVCRAGRGRWATLSSYELPITVR